MQVRIQPNFQTLRLTTPIQPKMAVSVMRCIIPRHNAKSETSMSANPMVAINLPVIVKTESFCHAPLLRKGLALLHAMVRGSQAL